MPMTAMELVHRFGGFVVSIHVIFAPDLVLSTIACMPNVDALLLGHIFHPFNTAFTKVLSILFDYSKGRLGHVISSINVHADRGNRNFLEGVTLGNVHKEFAETETSPP